MLVFVLIGCIVAKITSWSMLGHSVQLQNVEALVGWMHQGRYNGVGCGLTREAMTSCGLTRETMTLGKGDLNALSPIAQGTRSGSTREAVTKLKVSRRDHWISNLLQKYLSTPSLASPTRYTSPEPREWTQQAIEEPLIEPSNTEAVVTWRPWKVLERDKLTSWLRPLLPSESLLWNRWLLSLIGNYTVQVRWGPIGVPTIGWLNRSQYDTFSGGSVGACSVLYVIQVYAVKPDVCKGVRRYWDLPASLAFPLMPSHKSSECHWHSSPLSPVDCQTC